jgi:hypothetical protein
MSQGWRGRGALIRAAFAALVFTGCGGPATPANLSLLPPAYGLAQFFVPDKTSGLALQGFDPVSYFLGEGAKAGLPEHEVVWNGLAWRFASAANRQAFARDPEAYAPQFGGYDATGLAGGVIIEGNPLFAVVREDRLYLFRTDNGRARFLADQTIVARAEHRWPDLVRDLVQP